MAMKIERFITKYLCSNQYLLIEGQKGILIDPSENELLFKEQKSKNISIDYLFLTHEHYDHINGVNWWKKCFPKAVVFCSESCARRIMDPKANSSRYFEAFCQIQTWTKDQEVIKSSDYICYADQTYQEQYKLDWEGHTFCFVEAPGHSPGSTLILLDNQILFSGDSLLKDYPVATRFPGGSTVLYWEKTWPFIEKLSQDILVYPGHMESFRLLQGFSWKQKNRRDG